MCACACVFLYLCCIHACTLLLVSILECLLLHLQLFCESPLMYLLLGVDFRVKLVTIDCQLISLQLWDTAGQEKSVHLSHYTE